MNIFGGYDDFVVIFFGIITKLNYIKGPFLYFRGLFLRSRYRMGDIYGAAKISNIFGVLEIPEIYFFFLVKCRCWARAYV